MTYDTYIENRKKIGDILLRRHSFKDGQVIIDGGYVDLWLHYGGISNSNFMIEGVDDVS